MNDTFRCPICLFTMSRGEDYAPDTVLECASCGRRFVFKEALPPAKSAVSDSVAEEDRPEPEIGATDFRKLVVAGSIIALVAALVTIWVDPKLGGPDFILVYAICGLVTVLGQVVIRNGWKDLMVISVLAFAVFEIIGVTRIIHGYYFLEMRRWSVLLIMMGIGGLLHFARSQPGNGGGSGWGTSCSSGCSSCGGGGCGGGCGGCGGCGG